MGTLVKSQKLFYKAVKENKRFFFAIVICLIAIFKIQTTNVVSTEYLGIADTKEITINTSHAVKIKNIHVISGQIVKENELLIELERPDLDLRIYQLESELNELKAENSFNREMNGQLKSVKISAKNDETSPLNIKIESIAKQLEILKRKKRDLFVFSKSEGVIGSVNVKIGEDASPFSPLLTMHDNSPTMIKGFVHESIYNKTFKGQKVVVSSITDTNKIVDAVVASVGNRIVEYPLRLRKSETTLTYGREVIIFVPRDNPFLIGEKVQIKSFEKIADFMTAHADETEEKEEDQYFDLQVDVDIENKMIEPSGLLFIKDLNQTLVISDDTGAEDRAYIYTMNNRGNIDKEIEIDGIKNMSDMEAITTDENGFIYITSSLSKKKNGDIPTKRKKLIKVERTNFSFKLVSEINFHKALEGVALKNKKEAWAKFLLDKKKKGIDVNIEGIVVRDNSLYFGLRDSSRRKDSQLVLIKISGVDSLFSTGKLNADQMSISANIPFPKHELFADEGVSDLAIINNELFILTVNNEGKTGGRVFKTLLSDPNHHLTEVKRFYGLKPEGITRNSVTKNIIISFDQGSKTSKVLVLDSF